MNYGPIENIYVEMIHINPDKVVGNDPFLEENEVHPMVTYRHDCDSSQVSIIFVKFGIRM